MLRIEQIVGGELIAICKIGNTAIHSSKGITYLVSYQTTEKHKIHPNKQVRFELIHRYEDGMERLISKVYTQIEQHLYKK